jgi:hypothetical protein
LHLKYVRVHKEGQELASATVPALPKIVYSRIGYGKDGWRERKRKPKERGKEY